MFQGLGTLAPLTGTNQGKKFATTFPIVEVVDLAHNRSEIHIGLKNLG
jgi:hypothetical protein